MHYNCHEYDTYHQGLARPSCRFARAAADSLDECEYAADAV